MECPICYETINNSCVGSCMHHFCYNCLIKWIYLGGMKCPLCKKFIYEIKMDKEFDKLINNQDYTEKFISNTEYTKKIIIYFHDNTPPGITLTTNNGVGLRILKLNENDKFYNNNFKINDILLFVNNVPCISHREIINIITDAYENKRELLVESLNKKIKYKK